MKDRTTFTKGGVLLFLRRVLRLGIVSPSMPYILGS